MTGSAALINVRRIQRCLLDKMEAKSVNKDTQSSQNSVPNTILDSFLALAQTIFCRFFHSKNLRERWPVVKEQVFSGESTLFSKVRNLG